MTSVVDQKGLATCLPMKVSVFFYVQAQAHRGVIYS